MNDFKNTKVLMTLMGMEIGGAETYVLELCKTLKKQGLDIYVASNGGVYEEELTNHGITHFRLPLHSKNPKGLLSSYFALKRIIEENDITLVHAHARIPAFLCGLLQRKMGFVFVTTAHLNFNTAIHYKVLTNWGDATLAVSEDIKQYLQQNYKIGASKIVVSVNGINTENFNKDVDFSDIAREFNFDKNKKRIVYLSRLSKDRVLPAGLAAHKLVEIAEDIYRKDAATEIVIVGGGDDFAAISAKAVAVNSALGFDFIKMTGPRTDVAKFIAAADIFIGVSRCALEAMACEKPVILAGGQGYLGIFDNNVLEDAAKTNFTCRGFGETTNETLKNDIFELLDAGPKRLGQLGEFGRKIVQQRYSLEKMAEDTLTMYDTVRKSARPIDALISGYYGSNNHGDDALLRAITEDLRKIDPAIKICVISKRPQETKKIYNVETLYRFNFLGISRALKRTNLLIMGGGSLIQDLTSTRSLIYYTFVMNQAAKRRAKIMLYANGIGPLAQPKSKLRAVTALEKAEKITLRDAQSLEILKELKLKNKNVMLTADAAFRFKDVDFEGAARLLERINVTGKRYFCVSVRAWRGLKEEFITEMTVFCDYMTEKYDLVPLFIPMQPANDAEISTKILEKVKYQGFYLEEDFTVEEILAIVRGSEFMVGMRLHSIIYAANAATPIIGLVYDPKVAAIFKDLNQTYHMTLENISAVRLINFAEEVIDKREEIVDDLMEASKILALKSQENAVIAYDIIDRDLF